MINAEIRRAILEFLYDNADKHFESIELSNALCIDVKVINVNLRYLIEKDLVNPVYRPTEGYIVRIHANGIDYIESFRNVETELTEKDVKQEDIAEIKKLLYQLSSEILKSTRDESKVEKIISKLGKYSSDITNILSLIGQLKLLFGI